MSDNNREKATFGAGCFWCIEDEFMKTKGVLSTRVGFMGGTVPNVSYKQVCNGNTGHAEVIDIEFDPAEISYEKLLDNFWSIHNPTTLNRQGPDVGSQYRSAIFYHSPEQQAVAESSKKALEKSGRFPNPIVTEIIPAAEFYKAEEYHQKYNAKQRGEIT